MTSIPLSGGGLLRWMVCLSLAAPLVGATGLDPNLDKVDRLLGRWDAKDAPGVIVGVAQHGKIVHARGYGLANLEHRVPLTAETISESGSVAKQFTAAAVVLLAARGQLDLDGSVRTYLPELPEVMAAVTPRMLLNHTSGLRDIHGLFDLIGRPSYSSLHSNDEALRVVARQKALNFEPGTEYVYSNAGYIVAAELVERVSKTSLNAFCGEQLFRPRGMMKTRWRDDFTAVIPGRALGYSPRAAGGFRIDTPYSNLVGNGGLLTTVGDLLAWTASFADATGEWAEVVRQLQTPSKLRDGRPLIYGLGLSIDDYAGLREVSHGGATSGYRTFLTYFPERGTAIAVLSNAGGFNAQAVARAVTRLVLELPAEPRPTAIAVPAAEVKACAGLYHSGTTDALLSIDARDGQLAIGGSTFTPTAPRTFTSAGGQTTFVFAGDGREAPTGLTATSPNATTTFARRERAKPNAPALAAYPGTYYSEELEVKFVVEAKGGKLTIVRWPGTPISGEPTFADGFWFGREWHATFRRDAGGKVTGMEMTNGSGRCRRVAFVRR